ncbi:MAG: DNA repair protein RecO [Alphaproteobacteria bacterium]|nr:DNA repair protein RecO [Alphaproteobacteria bacterium]
MEWTDDGIVVAKRRHGESAAIVSLLTPERGRHAGLVRGGAGRRLQSVLQIGNQVRAQWRARLSEHLGTLTCELTRARAAALLDHPGPLAALASACALLETALPERHPYPALHAGTMALLDALEASPAWAEVYVRWEVGLLEALGYGLDLSACAATGATEGLSHVSPRSGRAVSEAAASPYRDRLFRLPGFLSGGADEDRSGAIRDGLALTGFFLERRVYAPHRHKPPAARTRLVEKIAGLNPTSGI